MQTLAELNTSLDLIGAKLDKMTVPTFSENKEYSEFGGGKSGFKSLGLMAVGGAVSPLLEQYIGKYLPFGSLTPLVVGFGLKLGVKNAMAQDVANGMIIASLSKIISNVISGKGFSFAEGVVQDDSPAFSEMRIGGVNFG